MQRTVYRTVQEALTNVRKHAPGATATIGISHDAVGLDVIVTNTAPTEPVVPLPSDGHGLVGLRERAELLGGAVQVGPTSAGGFQLRMRLPTKDRTPPHP